MKRIRRQPQRRPQEIVKATLYDYQTEGAAVSRPSGALSARRRNGLGKPFKPSPRRDHGPAFGVERVLIVFPVAQAPVAAARLNASPTDRSGHWRPGVPSVRGNSGRRASSGP